MLESEKYRYIDTDVVLTSYFNYSPDPQRGGTWAADFSAMVPLIESVSSHNVHCVVLNDCFGSFDKGLAIGHRVLPDTDLVPNVFRWFAQLQWLKQHMPKKAFMVDATDVEMFNDPFPHVQPGKIYVGSEDLTVDNQWMQTCQARHLDIPDYPAVIGRHAKDQLFNVGVVGGHTQDLIPLLEDLTEIHDKYSRGLSSSSDTAVFHYNLFKNGYHKKTVISPDAPVTTAFRKFEKKGVAWFRHK